MVASQNGWVANDRSKVASQLVPGTTVKLTVRTDDPGLLLLEVASAFDRLVENIDNGRGELDDWGYAERPIRGGTALSNHASGTAIDLNAPAHWLGAVGTFNPGQVRTIHQILAVTNHTVRWGGDYVGRKDEMHFEINDGRTMADCERALAAMHDFNGGSDLTPEQDAMLRTVHKEVTQRLKRRIQGSTYSDTVLGYAMNADSYGYRGAEALDRIEAKLNEIEARLTEVEK